MIPSGNTPATHRTPNIQEKPLYNKNYTPTKKHL